MCGSMADMRWLRLGEEKKEEEKRLEMWANAQRDGRPAKYRWRPLSMLQSLVDAQYWNAVP